MDFTVVGGDMRQAMLCELLADDGHRVTAFGFEKLPSSLNNVEIIGRYEDLNITDYLILPLPCCSSPGIINAPFAKEEITLKEILSKAGKKTVVLGGRLLEDDVRGLLDHKLVYADYFEREELTVMNALATAEGAIQLAMEETAATLHDSDCLVIGFGRIGKILAHRLKNLGARVAVSSRKYADKAWCKVYGFKAEDTGRLKGKLGAFDIVFNTVPSLVLDGEKLGELKKECLCIDLASKPGGIDMNEARKRGVRCIWALSLPSEVLS